MSLDVAIEDSKKKENQSIALKSKDDSELNKNMKNNSNNVKTD